MATRDEGIDLEYGEYVPVGHIWKFDLEECKLRNFGRKFNFSKFELSLSCSTFSRKLKISEIQDQNNQITMAGKYLEKAAGICNSQFPDTKQTRVEPSYPEIGEGVITEEECIYLI